MAGYFKFELTVDKLLESGSTTFSSREIVYRDLRRYTFSSFADKVKRIMKGYKKLGVNKGDKIGVIDWDTDVYLFNYYALPMLGSVLHTINIRYPPELILKTILHAEDKWLIVRDEFLPLLEKAKNLLPKGLQIIAYSDNKEPIKGYTNFWDLMNEEPIEPEGLKEDMPATIFCTSGTTDEPKGVWFTHRDLVLHALAVTIAGMRPPLELKTTDVYMILVPMFHVHQWGYPFVIMVSGTKYVLPGKYDPATELKLIANEKVTFSSMVPTILYLILSHPDVKNYLQYLRNWKVVIGGAALPEGLARKAKELGITVVGGYGLSETCPVLTIGYNNSLIENLTDEEKFTRQITAGTPIPLVQIKIADTSTGMIINERNKIGEIIVRSPWLTREYYKDPEKTEKLWYNDWLHTGDLGYLDEYNYLHIVDREKDAIKSGGEFIPSLLLEDVISLHPKVAQVAVVGMKDEKWGERPVAFIVPKEEVKESELREFLLEMVNQGKIQKWWIPDKFIFIKSMPLTSTNKIDKKALRQMLSQGM